MSPRNLFTPTALAVLVTSTSTQAVSLIYSDSFTASDGTALLGFSPEMNNGVVGATYHESNNFWTTNSAVGIFGNRAQLGADNQANLPIGSSGGFTQPEIIRISALMNLGNTGGPSQASTTITKT